MNIVLVNPEVRTSWQDRNKKSDSDQYMFPYSLLFLQNYLNSFDVESRIFDLYHVPSEDLIAHCAKLNAPIIGVTAQSHNRSNAIEIIREIKKYSPDAFIVVGGKHFTYCAQETLENNPEIDVVVRGEGEVTFYELITAAESNQSFDSIKGISFRENGLIKNNEERELESKIDKFNLDYSVIPTDGFIKGVYLRNFENEKIKSLPVILGRGCSQNCIFCVYRQMKYRVRSMDSVLEEIRYLKDTFNQNYFTFSDPSFTERRAFTKEFCEILIKENFNIKWYCEARADTPLDLLSLMAEAGCVSLDFALESGSPRILEVLKKRVSVPQAFEFAKNCKSLGIRTLVFFMVSLPEETEEDAEMTLDVIRQLSEYTKYITAGALEIFPGTELENIARSKGILTDDFSWYDERCYHDYPDLGPVNVPLYLENLSIEYIRYFLKEVEKIRFSQYFTMKDYWRLIRTGVKRIPNQSLSKTVSDVSRFTRGVVNRVLK